MHYTKTITILKKKIKFSILWKKDERKLRNSQMNPIFALWFHFIWIGFWREPLFLSLLRFYLSTHFIFHFLFGVFVIVLSYLWLPFFFYFRISSFFSSPLLKFIFENLGSSQFQRKLVSPPPIWPFMTFDSLSQGFYHD